MKPLERIERLRAKLAEQARLLDELEAHARLQEAGIRASDIAATSPDGELILKDGRRLPWSYPLPGRT